MASTEDRGLTARDAVLEYCTSWTQALYRQCWPDEGAADATTEMMEETRLAVERELMAMLRHEVAEQYDTAPASEPMREPAVLQITGDLDSDSEPDIMAGSFLGTYGKLDIDTAGHWTYRAGETRLREIKESGPNWFAHYDGFFVTHEDGSEQPLTFWLSRHRNDDVNKTAAFPTVGNRVSAETFGEDNELALKWAAGRDLKRKIPDPDQFDGPAPVPLWAKGRPGDDMPRREVTQDELRHLRLYPERDELSGGGLRFVGLLFFNAAEQLPVDETMGSDNAASNLQPKGAGDEPESTLGRPSLKDEIKKAYRDLADAENINFDRPRTEIYKPIRQNVLMTLGKTASNEVAGLGDETIRQTIAQLFDRDKEARPPSNKL